MSLLNGLLRRRGNPRYINPATGNDANDGRTPATAWASEVAANTALAVVGNGITHLRIDTSGAPLYLTAPVRAHANAQSGIVIEGATPGMKADLRAYKILSNAVFTQPNAATYPNVWSTTDTQARSVLWERGGVNAYDLIWYTHPLGASFAAVASTLNTTPGSFWTDGTTMYFRPLTGNDPVGDGKEYVRSRVFPSVLGDEAGGHAVELFTTGTVRNLMIGGTAIAGAALGSDLVDGAYCLKVINGSGSTVLKDLYLYNGGKHNLGLINGTSGNTVLTEDVQVEQCSPYATAQTIIVSYANASSANITHTYRRITCNKNSGLVGSMAGTVNSNFPTFYTHNADIGDPTPFNQITIEDCSWLGQHIGQGVSITNGLIINRVQFGFGIVMNAICDRIRLDAGLVVPQAATDSVVVTNSVYVSTVQPNSSKAQFRAMGTMRYENCTFDTTLAPTGSAVFWRFGTLNLTYKNNIHIANVSGSGNCGALIDGRNTDTLVFTRNNYYLASGKRLSLTYNDGATTSNRTFAQWQALGFDAGSIETNPLLNADYTPTASSPAIGLAVTSLTSDYIGDITPRVTSGAYEYRP